MLDHWLDDDRGELVPGGAPPLLKRGDIVKRNRAEERAYGAGHARRVARPVVPAEVAAADDDVAIRVRPRDAHRRGHAFGAALEELHHLGGGHVLAQPLREI